MGKTIINYIEDLKAGHTLVMDHTNGITLITYIQQWESQLVLKIQFTNLKTIIKRA
jgi:phosphosulfolactate phosphohydrolase-like enzyme